MIIDGRRIAQEVLVQVRKDAESLHPSFAAFAIAPSPATLSYLRIKERQAAEAGIMMKLYELPESITTEAVTDAVCAAKEDAVIVQLPLPDHIDTERVLEAIPVTKDADVLSAHARMEGPLMHPIAAAVQDILTRSGVVVAGARAVVVGQGWLVGKPVAEWLIKEGAEVVTVTREAGNLSEEAPRADIIVSGAGSPGLITKELVASGATVIDIGTSELGGSIAGDVEPDVADIAGVFTPVPGGVGPVAVAYLMKNVVSLARLRNRDIGVH